MLMWSIGKVFIDLKRIIHFLNHFLLERMAFVFWTDESCKNF